MSNLNTEIIKEIHLQKHADYPLSNIDIARKVGVSEKTVRRLKRRYNEMIQIDAFNHVWLSHHPDQSAKHTDTPSVLHEKELRQALKLPLRPDFNTGNHTVSSDLYRKVTDFIIPNEVYSFSELSEILKDLANMYIRHANTFHFPDPETTEIMCKYAAKLEKNRFSPDAVKNALKRELCVDWPKNLRSLLAKSNASNIDSGTYYNKHKRRLQPFYVVTAESVVASESLMIAVGKSKIEYIMITDNAVPFENEIGAFFSSLNSLLCYRLIKNRNPISKSSEFDYPSDFHVISRDENGRLNEYLVCIPLPAEFRDILIRRGYADTELTISPISE